MLSCSSCNKEFKHWGSLSKHTCFALPVCSVATRRELTLDQLEAEVNRPIACLLCEQPLDVTDVNANRFCSQSCAASWNNKLRSKVHDRTCTQCNKSFTLSHRTATTKFCSIACGHKHKRAIKDIEIESGSVVTRSVIRRYLIRKHGHKCMDCGLTTWKSHPIPLELDHIDGNALNNDLTNLRNLCPNCHAMTPTYKAKNKGNGRQSRGMRSV